MFIVLLLILFAGLHAAESQEPRAIPAGSPSPARVAQSLNPCSPPVEIPFSPFASIWSPVRQQESPKSAPKKRGQERKPGSDEELQFDFELDENDI